MLGKGKTSYYCIYKVSPLIYESAGVFSWATIVYICLNGGRAIDGSEHVSDMTAGVSDNTLHRNFGESFDSSI